MRDVNMSVVSDDVNMSPIFIKYYATIFQLYM